MLAILRTNNLSIRPIITFLKVPKTDLNEAFTCLHIPVTSRQLEFDIRRKFGVPQNLTRAMLMPILLRALKSLVCVGFPEDDIHFDECKNSLLYEDYLKK